MKRIKSILQALLLAMTICAMVPIQTGCQHRLAAGGVYTDKTLYEADNAISSSHAILQDFINWEKNNRAALAQWPEIRKLADEIYTNGPSWFSSASSLRDVYMNSPTKENMDKFQTSVTLIRNILQQASTYLTKPITKPAAGGAYLFSPPELLVVHGGPGSSM